MKRLLSVFVLGAALSAPATMLAGSTIERACLKSDRAAASAALCSCLQTVADAVLSSSYQRKGAAFFADPHKSQEVKASSRASDDAFWEQWEVFAATAEKYCE